MALLIAGSLINLFFYLNIRLNILTNNQQELTNNNKKISIIPINTAIALNLLRVFTISSTPSLFVAQRLSTHGEILGRLEVQWKKVACWSTKAALSLKRVKTEETLLWRAYRNSPTLFRTVPSPTPYGLLLPKIGVSQFPPITSIVIFSGLQIWPIHSRDPSEPKPIKNLEKRERERVQGLTNCLGYPHYLGNG